MRPRKHLLILSLDSLRAHMAPGRSYTAAGLACIFDGSQAAIAVILLTLEAAGTVKSHLSYREQRPERRRYYLAPPKRVTAMERGELKQYDLMAFARLAMSTRR